MKKIILIFVILLLPFFAANGFALNITTTNDGNTLVNTILGGGISVVDGSVSYTGSNIAAGTFSGGATAGIDIENGIVLTSGSANFLVNPDNNTNDASGFNNGLPGDSDLDGLITGFQTFDATILEFNFTTTGGDLYFNYVFGSEEYNEWVNSQYNDVFGFFLNGTNIALIPGTSTPVSINNVNNVSNSAYYNDNDPSNGTPTPYAFEYDGFTDVFTAQALDLAPGEHHIKLAIADAGDHILDSGVFIQAGSFSDTLTPTEPVPEPATILLLGAGLLGFVGTSRKKFKK